MSENTLYDKVWKEHAVGKLPIGQTQLFVGRHLMHEVTSPQAFERLREKGLGVAHPELTFATLDHIVPTDCPDRPFKDEKAELMAGTLEKNIETFGVEYFGPNSGKQGICHVVFPELGIIWPGQVAVCGDSHTCTYGAFGALAFGIGTTQVGDVLATQTLAMDKLKVKRVNFNGTPQRGVSAKDLALYMVARLGVKGGVGFAYEFGGEAIEKMPMEGRMTLCNMAVEAGARVGYVNPDEITFSYLRNRDFAPKEDFDKAVKFWKFFASGRDAVYDDFIGFFAGGVKPMITWGVNPGQAVEIDEAIPRFRKVGGYQETENAMEYMGLSQGQDLRGLDVDVVFIGSCTNGRFEDLNAAASILQGRKVKAKTIIVPGSQSVKDQAEYCHMDQIFKDAGAEWRNPGCSMCLDMNPDGLEEYQRCVSTSNRNFKGRQGPKGRTHLASPLTAAASAVEGKITDPREYLR